MAYAPPTPYGPLSGQVAYNTGLQLVDEILSTVAKQYRPHGFLYDDIVAPISVQYNIGRYPVFDPAAYFTNAGNLQVADDAKTPMIDFAWSTDKYDCLDYRLSTKLTRKEMVQAHPALRLDYSKTIGLLTVFAQNREARLAAKLLGTGSTDPITGLKGQLLNEYETPEVLWDAGVSGTEATIQTDLQEAAVEAYKQSGIWPNTLIIPKQVALAIGADYTLRQTIQYLVGPELIRRGAGAGETISATGGAGILPSELFGFKVLIADGTLINTARPGQAAKLQDIWGNNARLIYRPESPQWGLPSTVYSFRGRVLEGAGEAQPPSPIISEGGNEPGPTGGWAVVDRWFDVDPPAEHIRAWECVDERVVAPESGIIIPGVLTTF